MNCVVTEINAECSIGKRTGKKCYMLSARNLAIIWGDTVRHWEWTSLPESKLVDSS